MPPRILKHRQAGLARTFVREWRKHRGLSQDALVARVREHLETFSKSTLSRIENSKQAYTQPVLEALADALATDPASLLMRNPSDDEAIWSIWEQASEGERNRISEVANALKRAG